MNINWGTKVITVYKADSFMTDLGGGTVYEMDTDGFRLALKAAEDDDDGMPFPDTHRHNTEVVLAGVTFARTLEIINGYTVTFEDGQYAVQLTGSNNNLGDVMNLNQVSLRMFNSAGLQSVQTGTGLSPEEQAQLATAATESTAAHVDAEVAATQATAAHIDAEEAATQATTAATQATTAATQATTAATQATAAHVDAEEAATQATAAATDAATAATEATGAHTEATTAAAQSTLAAARALTAANEATDAAVDAELARKLSTNKAVISPDDQTVTIYDDDEVTPLFVFDISVDKRTRTPQ